MRSLHHSGLSQQLNRLLFGAVPREHTVDVPPRPAGGGAGLRGRLASSGASECAVWAFLGPCEACHSACMLRCSPWVYLGHGRVPGCPWWATHAGAQPQPHLWELPRDHHREEACLLSSRKWPGASHRQRHNPYPSDHYHKSIGSEPQCEV